MNRPQPEFVQLEGGSWEPERVPTHQGPSSRTIAEGSASTVDTGVLIGMNRTPRVESIDSHSTL